MSTLAISLRTASVDDAAAIAVTHLRSAQAGLANIFPAGTAPPPLADLVEDWRGRLGGAAPLGQIGIVAASESQPVVGVIIAGRDDADPTVGQLSRLYVDPNYWRLGIGGRVFRAAVEHVHRLGCSSARLWVLAENRRARAWYERMGWLPSGERKPSCEAAVLSMPAGVEDVRYWLPLDAAPERASLSVATGSTVT